MKLDIKDKKIIYELDKNCRQTLNEIARKVKLSKDVVNYRIKKLEKEGYLLGYQTLIDFTKIGYTAIRFHINLINTSPKRENEMINYLNKDSKVFLVSELEGYMNLSVGILIKENYELKEFQKEFENKFRENIKEFKIGIYMDLYHFNRDYLVGKNTKTDKILVVNSNAKIKIDNKDIEILKLLSQNSRIPIIEIATKLKMNANTIAARIKNLEKKRVILGYKIIFGFNKIGYNYIKADLILQDVSKEKEIISFCENHKNIVYALWAIGGADLEIFFEIESTEKFLQIMKEMRERFKEISEWKYAVFTKYHKFNYFLN